MNNALLRSLLFWLLFLALLFVSGNIVSAIPSEMPRLLYGILGVISAFLLIWLFLKNEKRSFADIGLVWRKHTLPKFLLGLVIGMVIMAILVFALVGFTNVHLKRTPSAIQPLIWLLYLTVLIPLAWMEELAFRSYTFLKLNKAYGLWWAQLVSALAFALYHIANGWSWHDAFLGTFVWAFVFGLAAIASRGVALPTGIHTSLNFFQAVSGMKEDKLSLWTWQLKPGHSAESQMQLDRVGIFIQVFILLAAIGGSALYIKWKGKRGKGKSMYGQ